MNESKNYKINELNSKLTIYQHFINILIKQNYVPICKDGYVFLILIKHDYKLDNLYSSHYNLIPDNISGRLDLLYHDTIKIKESNIIQSFLFSSKEELSNFINIILMQGYSFLGTDKEFYYNSLNIL